MSAIINFNTPGPFVPYSTFSIDEQGDCAIAVNVNGNGEYVFTEESLNINGEVIELTMFESDGANEFQWCDFPVDITPGINTFEIVVYTKKGDEPTKPRKAKVIYIDAVSFPKD